MLNVPSVRPSVPTASGALPSLVSVTVGAAFAPTATDPKSAPEAVATGASTSNGAVAEFGPGPETPRIFVVSLCMPFAAGAAFGHVARPLLATGCAEQPSTGSPSTKNATLPR